jgi:3'(2'), 5'-bisphosphate nucleotidase
MNDDFPFQSTFPETKLAVNAVIEAGKAVMNIYEQDFVSRLKDDSEPVTEADIRSNEIIRKILSTSGYMILSEESIDDKNRLEQKKIWIVDPLDGTSDFVNKTGEFTIMVAFVQDKKPILGVIFSPSYNELFVSQNGQGAYYVKEGKWSKIKVNDVSNLRKCRAVGSRFHASPKEEEVLKKIGVAKFSPRGSSLKVIDICLGNAELYLTTTNKMKQWDTCASYSMVTEAGGKMTDLFGNELSYNENSLNHQNGLLVTNGKIHDQVMQILNELKSR